MGSNNNAMKNAASSAAGAFGGMRGSSDNKFGGDMGGFQKQMNAPSGGLGPSNPPTPPPQSNEGSAQSGEAPQFGTAPNSGTSTDMSTAQPMQQMAGAMNQQPSQAQQFMGNQSGQNGGFGNYMLGPGGYNGLNRSMMMNMMQPQIMQMLNNMAPGFGNKAGQQMQQMMPQIQQGMNMNRGFNGGGFNRGIGPRWGWGGGQQRIQTMGQPQGPQYDSSGINGGRKMGPLQGNPAPNM